MADHHGQESKQTHHKAAIDSAKLAMRKDYYFAVYSNKGANRFSYLFSSINQRPLAPINTPATTQNLF